MDVRAPPSLFPFSFELYVLLQRVLDALADTRFRSFPSLLRVQPMLESNSLLFANARVSEITTMRLIAGIENAIEYLCRVGGYI